ncbi:antirestriction protein ArdA [uncultured Pseudosulfitobacter sp.]|uniref:antirestriction protein ArdA n=1 Tax=uncultured Pseudosulfitobacter sp. TaxID=2854214 RepID=UPI0030D825A7|tara:strand:- start:28 stop:651 length:624 start_codon:yes stop_codon:yes gene_type:complete
MRIYVACLASYNNGVLHGKWVDASSDVDEMQEEVDAILRASKFPNVEVDCPECEGTGVRVHASGVQPPETCPTCKGTGEVPSAEEWAIHDYDDLPNLGEYPGLQAIADYVELTEALDGFDEDEVKALVEENNGDLEAAKEMGEDRYCGTYESFRDYAEESADEMMACHEGKVPEFLTNYFDYDSYARDLKMDMTTIDTAKGVMVFHA